VGVQLVRSFELDISQNERKKTAATSMIAAAERLANPANGAIGTSASLSDVMLA
jgi:hypothetical protein